MSILSENLPITPKLEKDAEETKKDKITEESKIEKNAEEPKKSSMQILSELFGTFDAEPPVIVKKEKKVKDETHKKMKRKKRKHKYKDKKHKKSKKRKRSNSLSSNATEIDLAEILIKQEKDVAEKKIKIEGTSLAADIKEIKQEIAKKENEHQRSKNLKGGTPPRLFKKEEGELSDVDHIKKHKKCKHKEKKLEEKRRSVSRHHSRSREKNSNSEDLRNKIKYNKSSKFASKEKPRDSRHRSRERCRETSRESRTYRNNSNDSFYKRKIRDDSDYRSRYKDSEWLVRDKYRRNIEENRSRERHRESNSSYIDKKKLLEIARRNAIQMMKSGNLPGALTLGPQAQEKVIAAIKSGGKTIEELTDFCKSLSKKEELGELSSLSGNGSDTDELFHHPFQIKDRPTSITMNIKNSVPLPTKTTQERTTELRLQFPVSSGQQHRVNEEWVPVSPSPIQKSVAESIKPKVVLPTAPIASKKAAEAPVATVKPLPPLPSASVASVMPSPIAEAAPAPPTESSVDIGSIVSQRLTAMRKLQENPNDVQALSQMYRSNQEMKTWAESKQQFGQFTGSTGAQIMSQTELASGYQAWAKKDQLQTAAPVSGGMGMHLLQKMGWKPGEGLGKEKTGALEPLLLEVKLDKRGLVANEEQSKQSVKKKVKGPSAKSLQGKHPVSLLGEYTSKKKIGAPQYILEFECGPDHKKNFLFKVIVNGVEYKPNIASANKKEAKAVAATIALQQIGLLP